MSEPTLTLTLAGPESPPADMPEWIVTRKLQMRRLKVGVVLGLAAIALLTLGRIAAVSGWVQSVRIEGPSMAEAFVGKHLQTTCADCGLAFRCDAENVPHDHRAVCPNCGYRDNVLNEVQEQPGEQVLLDRWPLLARGPRRWDKVGFRWQDKPGETWAVKRVVALPGEQWAIREGDLYIDGRIERKSLAQLRQQMTLVHDNNFRPERTQRLPPRWQGESRRSEWQLDGSGLVFNTSRSSSGGLSTSPNGANDGGDGQAPDTSGFDWLSYRHWACTGSLAPRTEESPVLDNDSYNQNAMRGLNAVTDVALHCRVQLKGIGRFAIAASDEPHQFQAVFDPPRGRIVLLDGGNFIASAEIDPRTTDWDVFVALCDKRVLIAAGGRILIEHAYERDEPCETYRPFAIGGDSAALRVSELRVYRDLYYLAPDTTNRIWRAEQPLAAGHYALLGDNPPVSIDSRQAEAGVVKRDVLGVVYRPFWKTK